MDEREMMMQKRRKWMEERELEEKLSGQICLVGFNLIIHM